MSYSGSDLECYSNGEVNIYTEGYQVFLENYNECTYLTIRIPEKYDLFTVKYHKSKRKLNKVFNMISHEIDAQINVMGYIVFIENVCLMAHLIIDQELSDSDFEVLNSEPMFEGLEFLKHEICNEEDVLFYEDSNENFWSRPNTWYCYGSNKLKNLNKRLWVNGYTPANPKRRPKYKRRNRIGPRSIRYI